MCGTCRLFTRIPMLILLAVVIVAVIVLVVVLVPNRDNEETVILPLVSTSVGSIQGLRASDGEYDVFLGIPYAQVNASNPFGASTPYPNFDGTFVADDDSAKCPQMEDGTPVGSINCLQLNIIVPHSADSTNLLPVMVWIDGNDFETNSKTTARFGPKYLVRHDVIYVAINYRVGAYGFMCLDIPEVPGNQGLKDQVLALRWVRDNIEAFGGDVSRITAFGTSAGAQSIDFHILSDNEALFKNAILQSGSSLASTVFTEHLRTAPVTIAQHLGSDTNSVLDALTYLSSADANSVTQAWNTLGLNFKPCRETQFDNVEPFLTRSWVNATTPKAREMSILTGYNEHEQLLNYVTPGAFDNVTVVRDRLEESFNFDSVRLAAMEQNIGNFYFGDRAVTPDLIWDVVDFDSDYTYVHPIKRVINKYLESEAENVFLYVFSYNGTRNSAKFEADVTIGSAAHGDEAGYLFDMEIFTEEPTLNDEVMIDRMTTMWTNFAKYSNPTPETTDLLPVLWTPITNGTFNYLTIDSSMVLYRRPIPDRMAFWDLFYIYNGEYQKGYHSD